MTPPTLKSVFCPTSGGAFFARRKGGSAAGFTNRVGCRCLGPHSVTCPDFRLEPQPPGVAIGIGPREAGSKRRP